MKIHKQIAWSKIISSLLVGSLIPSVSLAWGIPPVGPPECVSGCSSDGDGSDNNGVSNHHPYTPAPSTVIKETFVIAVCANTGDPTSGCLGETVGKASISLGRLFITSYLKSYLGDSIRVMIPAAYSPYLTGLLLQSATKRAIATTQAKIENDLRTLQTYVWPTEADRVRGLAIIRHDEVTINKWGREAREEANKGINWTHNWNANGGSSHDFRPGPAYEQLKTISSLGWLQR